MHQLNEFLARWNPVLEGELAARLPRGGARTTPELDEAIKAAVFPGGRRMRPLFTLLGVHAVGGDPAAGLPVACAVEYLHCSSLIFDDLPAMDNADERRGTPSLHRRYGGGLAILAALALLNEAYALVGEAAIAQPDRERGNALWRELCAAIGPGGMIGGQAIDLARGDSTPEHTAHDYRKTTALTGIMLSLGAIAVGGPADAVRALAAYGESFGLAYQLLDDLADDMPGTERHARLLDRLGCEAGGGQVDALIADARTRVLDILGSGPVECLLDFGDLLIGQMRQGLRPGAMTRAGRGALPC